MTSPPNDRSGFELLSGRTISPRTLILLVLIALVVTTFLAIAFTNITGGPDDEQEEDVSELLARTGCLDMEIRPAQHDPPVSLFQAEADVRGQIDQVEAVIESDDDDDEFVPGDLVWAEYGELAPGTTGRVQNGEAWVLVFEDDRHESWWDRLANRRIDARFSVVYRPESGTIIAACSGEV